MPTFDTDQPRPYQGRLDVCPWCRTRPSLLPTPPDRWRIECINQQCKNNPMSYSFATPGEAADSWNYLIKGTR